MTTLNALPAAYEAEVPADYARISGLRRIISAHARLWGADNDAVGDAVLIIDELFANAVRYGSTSPDDTVTISLSLDGPELRIAVSDTAPGTPRRHLPGDEETNGRGLFLVEALAAKWGVDPHGDGKRTWAVLTLPSRSTGRDPQTAA